MGRCPPATSGTRIHCLQSLIILPAQPVHTFNKSVYRLKYLTPQNQDLTEFLIITHLVKKCSRFYALTHSHKPIIVLVCYPGPDEFKLHIYAIIKFYFSMPYNLSVILSTSRCPTKRLYASLISPLRLTNSAYLTLLSWSPQYLVG